MNQPIQNASLPHAYFHNFVTSCSCSIASPLPHSRSVHRNCLNLEDLQSKSSRVFTSSITMDCKSGCPIPPKPVERSMPRQWRRSHRPTSDSGTSVSAYGGGAGARMWCCSWLIPQSHKKSHSCFPRNQLSLTLTKYMWQNINIYGT
jgi:hypothetical protein